MRPVVDAAVIAALRAQVIEHNKANPSARVKLQELKKAWIRGYWKRGAHTAEAAVQKHLAKRLGSVVVSPESIAALAKAEFDESKVRRDGDGKFAPKGGAGGGRRAAFEDVRSRDQYSALRSENEGYRADTTQVIPNTVGTTFAPWLAAGGVTVLGAGRTALADKNKGPDAIGRIGGRMVGAAVAVPAGVVAGQAGYLGTKAANAVRAKWGGKQADPSAVADRLRQKARSGAMRAANRATIAMDRAFYFAPRSLIQSAKDGADADGLTGARRSLRVFTRGRVPAAAYGGIAAGLVAAPLFYRGGQVVGPMYDYFTPRRVEKMAKVAVSPESVELLNKAAIPGMAGLRQGFQGLLARLRSNATAAAAQAPKAAAKAPKAAAPATGANRKAGTTLARQQMSRFRRSPGVGAALGGLAGGAVAGGAALGVRRYYRDEDGKFTSKDRDVSGMAAAGGAVAGALAGFAFTRGRNQAFARQLAERARELVVSVKTKSAPKAPETTEIMPLGEALKLAAQRKIKRDDISLPEPVASPSNPADGAQPAKRSATGTRTIKDSFDRRYQALKAAAQAKIDEADTVRKDFMTRMKTANSQGGLAWQEFQMDRVLRGQLSGLADDAAFKGPSQKSIKDMKLTGAQKDDAEQRLMARNKLLSSEPVVIMGRNKYGATQKSVKDPLGDLIEHARLLNAAQGGANPAPKSNLWDMLTPPQQNAISSYVRRADDALEDAGKRFKAREKLQSEIDSLRAQQTKLRQDDLAPGETADMLEEGSAKAKRQKRITADLIKVEKDLADKTAEFDRDFKTEILAENPFLSGARLEPQLKDDALEALFSPNKEQVKLTEKLDALNQRYVQEAIRYIETSDAAARPSSARRLTDSALSRAGAPLAAFGRQSKRILNDARDAMRPKMEDAYKVGKDYLTRGGKVVFGDSAEGGSGSKGIVGTIGGKINDFKAFLVKNRKEVGTTLALLSAGGIVDVYSDGRLDFNFDRTPEAYKHLIDKKTRPEPYLYWLNGGRDIAYIMVGKTKATKGQESTKIILSGVVVREDGQSEDLKPMMPLKTWLDRNQGGGGGGGGRDRGAVELRGEDAKQVGNAIGALRRENKIKRAGDEEEGYEYRDGEDKSQQNAANTYLNQLKRAAGEGRKNENFYGFLESVFGENGAILKLSEKRQALFGSRNAEGKIQNDGLFNGGNAFRGYHNKVPQDLYNGLKERITDPKLPAPTDEQAVLLRHMVNLAGGNDKLDRKQVTDLRSLIGQRVSGGGVPGAAGAQANAGGGPRPLKTNDEFMSAVQADFERFQKEALKDFGPNASGLSEGNWKEGAKYQAESYLKELRDTDEAKDWSDEQLYEEARRRIRQSLQLRTRRNQAEKSFDQAAFLQASIELLAKANIPAEFQGSGRQFDEAKIRRAPKGSDKGGEFAPKAGGGAGGAPSRRTREPTPKEDKRSYFEPTRFGNTLGSAIGSQGAFEIASRFLPGPLKTAGFAKRLAFQLGAAMAGGVAGGMAGEEIGRASYTVRGKAPPKPFEPPNRPLTEEAARTAGNLGGSMLSALTRSPMRGFGLGVGGQLSGEELAAGVHDVVARLYGPEIAAQARAAVTPRRQQQA